VIAAERIESGSPGLDIRLFGRFEVLRQGAPLPDAAWRRRKNKTLLKVLLADPGRTQSQDQLIDILFEGEDPGRAAQNLHARVSELRRILQPGLNRGRDSAFILGRSGGYCFAPGEGARLDTEQFSDHIRRAQTLQSEERWPEAATEYSQAAAICRGELFEEDRYEEWAIAAREAFGSMRIDGLMQLAECLSRIGETQRAIDACRQVLSLQPHCEPVYRQLMRYRCQAGEYAQALVEYERCAEVLDEYLGVEPDPQTQELYHRIKSRDPELLDRPLPGHRLAVLPLRVGPDDAALETLAASIGEQLTLRLSQVDSVWVPSWHDVAMLESRQETHRELAKRLRVQHLLEGTITQTARGLSAACRLVDIRAERHLWAGRCSVTSEGERNPEAALVEAIAAALAAHVSWLAPLQHPTMPASQARTEGERPDVEAWLAERSEASLDRAVAQLRSAADDAPSDARLWSMLATAYTFQAMAGFIPLREIAARAVAAARDACRCGPDDPRAHLAAALVAWQIEGDARRADEAFRQALALDPSHAGAAQWYASFLLRTGRIGEGVTRARQAHALDPQSVVPDAHEVHARPWVRAMELPSSREMDLPTADVEGLRPYMPSHAIAKLFTHRSARESLKWLTFLFVEADLLDRPETPTDPEPLGHLAQEVRRRMVHAIARFGGTIAQLRMFGVFSVFGVPETHEDDIERAVRSAVALCDRFRGDPLPGFKEGTGLRIGIDVGRVLVEGEAGPSVPFLPVGAAVRTAARLESSAGSGEILISHRVFEVIDPLFETEPVDEDGQQHELEMHRRYRVLRTREVSGKARGLAGMQSPLVGRETEFTTLLDLVERLRAGHGAIVSIIGDAGIGKTRLLSELLRQDAEPAIRCLWVRCASYERELPYRGCRQIVAQCVSLTGANGAPLPPSLTAARQQPSTGEDGGRSVAFLEALLGTEDGRRLTESLEPELIQRGIASSVVDLLQSAAAEEPLAIVFDDVHWMDEESISVLGDLVALVDREPLLLILVHRPVRKGALRGLQESLLFELRHRYHTVELAPLAEEDERSLLANLFSHCVLPEELFAFIVRRSEGNPLFAEEVVRLLIDEGYIRQDEDGVWSGVRRAEVPVIPPRLRGLLEARIHRLSGDVREVLQLAAVIGRAFDRSLLAAVGLSTRALDEALSELQRTGLVRQTTGADGQRFAFRHELMLEAAYETLPPSERIEFHRRIAEAIEARGASRTGDEEAVLGTHYYRAQAWEQAIPCLLAAAESAWTLYKSHEAATLYDRAVDAADRAPSPPEDRFALRRRRVAVLALLGRTEEEARDLETLRQLADEMGTAEAHADVAVLLADHHARGGRFREALAAAEAASERLGTKRNSRLRLLASIERAEAATGLGRLEEARDTLEMVVREELPHAAEDLLARAYKLLGTVAAHLGEYARAATSFREARALYAARSDHAGEGRILVNLGALDYFLGRFEDALHHTREAQGILGRVGDRRGQATSLTNIGLCHSALGDPAAALPYLTEARHIYRELGDAVGEANSVGNIGFAHEAIAAGGFPEFILTPIGDRPGFSEAVIHHEQALALHEEAGSRTAVAIDHFNLGSTAFCRGDPDAAREHLTQAGELAGETGSSRLIARVSAAMARLFLQEGQLEAAHQAADDAVERDEREGLAITEEVRFTRAAVLRALDQWEAASQDLQIAAKTVHAHAATIQDGEQRTRYLATCQPILDALGHRKREAG
jgi:predicted ATPase/DNA-binding SARP family transcriptional activator/class 3 adenylate cyclase/cytochrome c-type biogenesis protein CcmH/NrfG